MLHHLSLGVRDLDIAGRFMTPRLAALGYRRVFEDETAIGYGVADDEDALCLKLRDDAAAPGPGFHLAFAAASAAAVDASTQQPSPTEALTMERPDCAPITVTSTTPRSWSTPRAIASRR